MAGGPDSTSHEAVSAANSGHTDDGASARPEPAGDSPADAADIERANSQLPVAAAQQGPALGVSSAEISGNSRGDGSWDRSRGPDLQRPRTAAELGFAVTGERERWSRWLTLYDRTIRFPAHGSHPAQEHDFDIIGHPRAAFSFVVVFPFHPNADGSPGGQVTVLREFAQGVGEMMWVLPTGAYDPGRHASVIAAGQAELSEEAHLAGGEWVSLLPGGHPGVPEVKWCRNRMLPFLCIGPTPDAAPVAREAEEFIEVHRVSIPQLRALMRSGDMLLPSVATCTFALDELRERGLL